jgi:hypothetical protein
MKPIEEERKDVIVRNLVIPGGTFGVYADSKGNIVPVVPGVNVSQLNAVTYQVL